MAGQVKEISYNVIDVYRYEVYLSFSGTRYDGKVSIELEASGDVRLDAVGLSIRSTKVNGRDMPFEAVKDGILVRSGPFSGVLTVEFSGEAPDKLVGIYRAPYNGDYIISTQFESVHAREMFPCVDHPAFKARFKLVVEIPRDLHAISNMPIERVTLNGDRKVVEFAETPPMSTYLLYLGIGRWEELVDPRGKYLIATVPGRSGYGRLALEYARKSVDFYERYFGIPYPLPKMHLIAVPEFAFGAMENWGAITFRENALLAPESPDVAQRRRIAEVVAHEIAHQWFGDLVTMEWWDDLWLNESFATFMSYKAVDSFAPELRMWDNFLLGETDEAMLRDSLRATHPIHAKVNTPDEIESIFDEISYGKGASVLRMIEYFLGESFRKGLSSYLEHHAYSNARAQDLWEAIQPFTQVPVAELMNDWIMKPGYPYVRVLAEGSRVELEQHRFSLTGGVEDLTYMVPLTLSVNGRRLNVTMNSRTHVVEVGEPVRELRANLDRAGFYRVLYSDLSLLPPRLGPLESYGLLNDYYYFMMAGLVDKATYLKVAEGQVGATEYLPIYELSNELYELQLINSSFKDLALRIHRQKLQEVSSSPDETMRELAGRLANRLATMDRSYAEQLAPQAGKVTDPNMKQATYTAYAVATSDLEGLKRFYESEQLDSEKVKVITAAMYIPDRSVLERAIEWVASLKRQDLLYVFMAAYNPSGRDTLWSWIKSGMLDTVASAFKGTAIAWRWLGRALPLLGLGREQEVRSYIESRPEAAEPNVRAGLELLEVFSRVSRL